MNDRQQTTVTAERDARGRFLPGNKGGPGNPFAAQVGRLRAALLRAVKPADLREVVTALLEQAKSGNVAAARLVLEYCLGRPVEADVIERIEAIERRVLYGPPEEEWDDE